MPHTHGHHHVSLVCVCVLMRHLFHSLHMHFFFCSFCNCSSSLTWACCHFANLDGLWLLALALAKVVVVGLADHLALLDAFSAADRALPQRRKKKENPSIKAKGKRRAGAIPMHSPVTPRWNKGRASKEDLQEVHVTGAGQVVPLSGFIHPKQMRFQSLHWDDCKHIMSSPLQQVADYQSCHRRFWMRTGMRLRNTNKMILLTAV